jgi:triosephosphate isomerase
MRRRRIVIGNWKMNLDHTQARILLHDIKPSVKRLDGLDVMVLPSFTAIHSVCQYLRKHHIPMMFGAQNVSDTDGGSYTGDVSASMLRSLGCSAVLIGHSERRMHHHEDNACLTRKLQTTLSENLTPIFCIGESAEAYEQGQTEQTIISQLSVLDQCSNAEVADMIIGYEPVWAIGSGSTPSVEDIGNIARSIREYIRSTRGKDVAKTIRIVYGGSVNMWNAAELSSIDNLDGFLVGDASLQADTFLPIISSLHASKQ